MSADDVFTVAGWLRWSVGLSRRRSLAAVWSSQLGLEERLCRCERTYSLQSSISVHPLDRENHQRALHLEPSKAIWKSHCL